MNPSATVTADPLPGYEITERIGSGGYGEVFKAIAPGGIEKAVKSLYGYHDEELAARELKALERIKGLRHPFLLSLDRFEIVDGRLYVVTELADGSLDDCFQRYRRQGQNGIPRQELLSYIRDAADALDYMQNQHGLQHLDVKPENLLLVGGHVKVADFGLVKDVQRASQYSQVGGMTPTYAAPELFDNRPGARTDQYSLAIVYQELLTGMLPFPGRTAAQLVAQHTGSEPRLSALPEYDQPVIHRALSKNPDDRFPSCMAMVEALTSAPTEHFLSKGAAASTKDTSSALKDDTKGSPICVTERMPAGGAARGETDAGHERGPDIDAESVQRWGATERMAPAPIQWSVEPLAKPKPEINRDVEQHIPEVKVGTAVVDADVPAQEGLPTGIRPTLLIGLGGQAASVLMRVRQTLLALNSDCDWQQLVPMLVLDTDRSTLRRLESAADIDRRAAIKSLLMPLKFPQHYRSRSSAILQWLSRRWLYNIPRSLQTNGLRPLGRLALVDNAESVMQCVAESIERVLDKSQLRASATASNVECQVEKPRVILVASTCGGTGSGIALDLAWAIRNMAEVWGNLDLETIGVFGDCSSASGEAHELAMVNTLAFLREFSSMGRQGNRNPEVQHERTKLFEGEGLPLNHTYFVSGTRGESRLTVEEWVDETAEYLATNIASGCGPLLDACRGANRSRTSRPDTADHVRSFVVAPLNERQDVLARLARDKLCEKIVKHWRQRAEHGFAEKNKPKKPARGATPPPAPAAGPAGTQQDAAAPPLDPVECLEEAMRSEFGAAVESVFAVQLANELRVKLRLMADQLRRDQEDASGYYIQRLVRHAFDELTAVACQFVTDLPEGAVMSARCLKSADWNDQQSSAPAIGDPYSAVAEGVARQVGSNFAAALVEATKPSEVNLKDLVQGFAAKALDEMMASEAGRALVEQLASCKTNTSLVIESAVIGPPQCGHRRHTLVVMPEAGIEAGLEAEIKAQLPTAPIVKAKVSRPLLIREAANLSIAQIASRILHERPDLNEPSLRLQTRSDLALLPLPRAVVTDANT